METKPYLITSPCNRYDFHKDVSCIARQIVVRHLKLLLPKETKRFESALNLLIFFNEIARLMRHATSEISVRQKKLLRQL